ncbi:hypothetical protein [Rhodoferax sp.]|uniref:hypothetical protein n=1 Tax=Rhodoferax sp. TaxID=50421 RepID=UPI002612C95F|nr:hypothetical protein [Rhodoferax sp.]MDD2917945.1 hypothetical protein [Rhodoferax sp.]
MSALLAAVDVLNDRLIAADAIGEALDLAGGEDAPAWVRVFRNQIEAIREASEALECLVRGIGGVTPDEAKRSGIEGVSP